MTDTYPTCMQKQRALKARFADCTTPDELYRRIIEIGREQPPFPTEAKCDANRVRGCQSQMYLNVTYDKNLNIIHFNTESDALISAGLGQLLVLVYSGESPEAVLKCAPEFLADLGIITQLTPSRANGLAAVHLRMKQEALSALTRPLPASDLR